MKLFCYQNIKPWIFIISSNFIFLQIHISCSYYVFPLATEVPRTQNPLFKRRLTLISTTPPSARTTNPPVSGLETTTTLYLNDDDEDQVAKSSIHTSRFNQIPEQVRPREEYDLALPAQPLKSTSTTVSTTANAPLPVIGQGIRKCITIALLFVFDWF